MDNQNIVQHMVREGVVSTVNETDHTVRVKYPDTDVLSGWLNVVRQPVEDATDWMPSINDRVLVLYIPIFNGDGYVLGGL